MKTLIVIDMQNDFIYGALGNDETRAIVDKVATKIKEYQDNGDEIIYTRDTHNEDYLNTSEGKKLPVIHCVKNTHGWEIVDGLYVEDCEIIDKPTFGWMGWQDRNFTEIELIGVCTDICVVSNALILKAVMPNADIKVDASCCAGVTPKSHLASLETMKMCQIDIINE